MAEKAVAAMLLVAMVAWAEMTMAPMLAMHAGHMRPGHEMAADMPAERAAHHHAELTQMGGHPCCPGLHRAELGADLALTTGTPPCGDPHDCCFRHGPQSVPAPAIDLQKLTREMMPARVATPSPTVEVANRRIDSSVFAFRSPPDILGMILRV